MHSNDFSGTAFGPVVQARDVYGGVHLHQTTVVHPQGPLHQALVAATLTFETKRGRGMGVRVSPIHVLTARALITGGSGPIVLRWEDAGETYACLSAGVPGPASRWVVDQLPGAPVLDLLTGSVCGVVGETGEIIAITEVPPGLNHHNDTWLDLLTPEQLAAAGRTHVGPDLRSYLRAIATADREHEHEWVRGVAPSLSSIYLTRRAVRYQDEMPQDELDAPERISAEELMAGGNLGAQVIAQPGAGKSSLLRRIAATSAARWLADREGDLVPVPIAAEVLARGLALPDALAEGVLSGFSHELSKARLSGLFGAPPTAGARWLVLVDALDEVHVARRPVVIRNIRDHRLNDTHRFVVTTRPLNQDELDQLVSRDSPSYVLELFSDAELTAFVTTWLTKKGVADPAEEARTLLDGVSRTKLVKLVHVPLIATMLCVLRVEHGGDLALPTNQTQLYRRFIEVHLAKVHQSGALLQFRERLAPKGESALRAVNDLVENLERMLQEISYGRLFGDRKGGSGDSLELAASWSGARPPAGISERDWTGIVSDVLRLSGILVQRGRVFAYQHETFEEYLAASLLFRRHPRPATHSTLRHIPPRRKWPWPNLQTKVFLAALWLESGHPLDRPLWLLMSAPFRWHNIGFVYALAEHGALLSPKTVDKAVEVLSTLVRKRSASGDEWHDRAQWLWGLRPERAISVLTALVTDSRQEEHCRYRAVIFLHDHAPERSEQAVRAFIADPGVPRIARFSLGKVAYESNADLVISVFVEVAEADPYSTIAEQALDFISTYDHALGVAMNRDVVKDGNYSDSRRLSAARSVHKVDIDAGIDLLCHLVGTAEIDTIREAAIDVVLDHDEPRLRTLLVDITGNKTASKHVRFECAWYLVHHLRYDAHLLVALVKNRDFSPEQRVRVALATKGPDMVEVLLDVVRTFEPEDDRRLWAIEQLGKLSPPRAVEQLAEVVRDSKARTTLRFQALQLIAKRVSIGELVKLHEVIVKDPTVHDTDKLTAAMRILALDRARGRPLVMGMATNTESDLDMRLQAATAMTKENSTQGAAAFESIVRTPELSMKAKSEAVAAARAVNRSGGDRLARVVVKSCSKGLARLEFVRQHFTRTEAGELLLSIASDHREIASVRIEAAVESAGTNVVEARRVLRAMSEERDLSRAVRQRAGAAAAELEH